MASIILAGWHLYLGQTHTKRGLTQPDQVCEFLQALDPLNDIIVQLQLPQVLKLPEVVNSEDVCNDQRRGPGFRCEFGASAPEDRGDPCYVHKVPRCCCPLLVQVGALETPVEC